MKKVLAILVATALVGAYVFADDAAPVAKINGKVESGFTWSDAHLGKTADSLVLKDKDDSGVTLRAELGGSISTDNYGVVVNLRTDTDVKPTVTITDKTGADVTSANLPAGDSLTVNGVTYQSVLGLQQAYAWTKFLNKVVTVKVGIIDETSTSTGGDAGFLKYDPAEGASVTISPIAGLAIDWLVPLSSTANKTAQVIGNSTIAAKYTMDKVFDVAVGLVGNNTGVSRAQVAYGFDLLAVQNLSLNAEGDYVLNKDYGISTFDEKIGYTIDKLNIYVLTYQYLKGTDSKGVVNDAHVNFKPGVSYDLGVAVVGASFKYDTGASGAADAKKGFWDLNANASIPVGPGKVVIGGDLSTGNAGTAKTADIGGDLYTSYEFTF